MKIFIIYLFLILEYDNVLSSDPNFCSVPDSKRCDGRNLVIHVIENDILLTSSTVDLYYNNTNSVAHINIECSENQYKTTVPMDEVAFWKTGDAIHISSLSTFSKMKSCIELNCQNPQEVYKLETCITKPVLPICSFEQESEVKFNDVTMEPFSPYYNIDVKIGRHGSIVKTETEFIKITCDETEKIYNVSVQNDGTSDLAIHGNVLNLIHRYSPIALPNHVQSPKFCLLMDGEYGPLKASYCFPDPKIILKKACRGQHCVKKCCPPGYLFDSNLFSCVTAFHSPDLWKPNFYNPNSYSLVNSSSTDYSLVIGMPHCPDFYSVATSDGLRLLSNGTLNLENGNLFFSPVRYCIDNFNDGKKILELGYVCFEEQQALVQSTCVYIGQKIYPILLLISSAFLLLTIITYALVPELHAKIQSKCLLSSVSALLLAYIALAVGQLYSPKLSLNVCISLGIFIQFTVLASFFWLNVMCFDIWTTLRSIKPSRDALNNPKTKFLLYSLYGWGCPLVISSVTAIMQFTVSNNAALFLPRIGETGCFFSAKDPASRWIYLYSFICAILVVNTIFFIHLAIILIRAQHTSEITLGKKGQYREWMKLYIKLFFVMGVSWLFEAISWDNEACSVWIATDIINALRGVFIFIIFVCKKDVFLKLKNRSKAGSSQVTNTIQSSYLRSSTKNSTRVNQNQTNDSSLHETTNQVTSQTGDEITVVATSRH